MNMLLILLIFLGVQWFKARPLASGSAPDLIAETTTAQHFELARWRGQPVLVHFWAVWCPVCELEEHSIDALSEDYRVMTIAMQSGSDADINAYQQQQDVSFPVIADPYGEIATQWGVRGVPASFVIDANGMIRFASVGYSTSVGLRGRLWAADHIE
ncbi:MAG: protein disulfide oxidoreductase [Thiohalocapsa sp.]